MNGEIKKYKEILERVIDEYTITNVLDILSSICYKKAATLKLEQVEINYTEKQPYYWIRIAEYIDLAANKARDGA